LLCLLCMKSMATQCTKKEGLRCQFETAIPSVHKEYGY